MANKKRKRSPVSVQGKGVPALLPTLLHSRVMLVAIMVLVAGVGSYLARSPIGQFFTSVHDRTVGTLGLGLALVVLWLAVFVFALVVERSWFRRANLWVGSVGLVALAVGMLAFFQPYSGVLSWFTLSGDVSLGGNAGEAIIGSSSWLGALRLLGILMVSVAVSEYCSDGVGVILF